MIDFDEKTKNALQSLKAIGNAYADFINFPKLKIKDLLSKSYSYLIDRIKLIGIIRKNGYPTSLDALKKCDLTEEELNLINKILSKENFVSDEDTKAQDAFELTKFNNIYECESKMIEIELNEYRSHYYHYFEY